MILVDSRIGSYELIPHIQRIGVDVEETHLDFADVMFEGNGRQGPIQIGIERKTLHDMIACIDDSRFAGHQMPGMLEMYGMNFLLVEGMWDSKDDGTLLQGFRGGSSWGECKFRTGRIMYSKLRRYLFSVQLSGVTVLYTRDIRQSARDICELYHYFQKQWTSHRSMLEVHKKPIPTLSTKISLCRRWADALTDVGVTYGMEAERLFNRRAIDLAKSSELDWMRIKGIGVSTAKSIIRQIWERQ